MPKKYVKIDLPYFDCEECRVVAKMVYNNCTKTFSECRHYRKDKWSQIDKQITKIRKNIFENNVKK